MYIRNCPKCNKEISYTTEGNLKRASRENKICKSCSVKLRNDNPEYLKKISDGRKKYWSEISEEEKENWRLKNSEAQKSVWEARDNEF
jgi:transcription elongation factor Elf1